MYYTLTIGGKEYQFITMNFKREASLESQVFRGTLAIPAGVTLPAFNDSIIVKKQILQNNILKWQGKVNQVRYLPMFPAAVEVIGYDLARKLNYLKVPALGYSATKGSTIFVANRDPEATTDLIANTTDTSDPSLDSIDLGKSKTGQEDAAFTRRMALDLVQMVSDRDIYVERDGHANFLNPAGVNRSATLILEHGLNGFLTPDIFYLEDETRRIKKVITKGKGVGDLFYTGSSGSPAAADKIRPIELPFLVSKDTLDKAATNILAELDRTIKYAMFTFIDVFTETYDVYDTVRLKARLPVKNIDDSTMKIFSIETTVSGGKEQFEIVILELLNFRRGIWAKLVDPLKVAEAEDSRLGVSIGATQVLDHVGMNSIVTDVGATRVTATITSAAFVDIGANTFASTPKNTGCHIMMGIRITPLVIGSDFLLIKATDGTTDYPASSQIRVQYNDMVYKPTFATAHLFIPADVSGKTITLKGLTLGDAIVRIDILPFFYAIGEG